MKALPRIKAVNNESNFPTPAAKRLAHGLAVMRGSVNGTDMSKRAGFIERDDLDRGPLRALRDSITIRMFGQASLHPGGKKRFG